MTGQSLAYVYARERVALLACRTDQPKNHLAVANATAEVPARGRHSPSVPERRSSCFALRQTGKACFWLAVALASVLAVAPFVTPLTMDEPGRIASNNAKLPELLPREE